MRQTLLMGKVRPLVCLRGGLLPSDPLVVDVVVVALAAALAVDALILELELPSMVAAPLASLRLPVEADLPGDLKDVGNSRSR